MSRSLEKARLNETKMCRGLYIWKTFYTKVRALPRELNGPDNLQASASAALACDTSMAEQGHVGQRALDHDLIDLLALQ